jgi:serine/threonine protein kinase
MSNHERFENYEVLRRKDGTLHELGRGAMGVTYKAWDTDLHCEVALKVVNLGLLDSGAARERFMREARAAAKLHHPNIATVFRLGKADGDTHFYAMEFCEGPTLQQAVAERGCFDARLAVEVALQVSKALIVGETHHVVHRDLKPSNIILSQRSGEGLVVKVIDFGVAKCLAGSEQSMVSATTGGFVGTAQFASPEQLEEQEVDIRSDIYSLGVCTWYMLTGRPVFEGPMARVMAQTLSAEPSWDQLSGQSPALVTLLKRMLAKEPDLRPMGAIALRDDLDACTRQFNEAPSNRPRRQAILSGLLSKQTPATEGHTSFDSQKRARPDPPSKPTTLPPNTSRLLLNRYQLVRQLSRDGLCTLGVGWDRMNGRARVMLRIFDSGALILPSVRRLVERRIKALSLHPHPALPSVLDFAEHQGEWVLATELRDDARGVDLMKVRGSLLLSEVLSLLEPVAAALDHGEAKELELPPLTLHRLVFTFHSCEVDVADILPLPIREWPAFAVKLNAPAFDDHINASVSDTISSMRTQAGAANAAQSNLPGGGAASTACVIYELMGGNPGGAGYKPLARLSEAGNTVLRRAMDGGFKSALNLIEILKQHVGYEVRPTATPAATRMATPASCPPRRWIKYAWISTGAAALIAIVALYHFGIQQPREQQRKERADSAAKEKREIEDKLRAAQQMQEQAARATAEATQAREDADRVKAAAEAKARELQAMREAAEQAEKKRQEEARLQAAQIPPPPMPSPASPAPTIPAPVRSPPVTVNTGAAGVKAFVENMQILEDRHELDPIMAQYAARVSYYGRQQLTRDEVRKDKADYFLKWPKTTNKIKGNISITKIGSDLYLAAYTDEFRAENPASGEWFAGDANRQLTILEAGLGDFLIIQEEAVVTRKTQGGLATPSSREAEVEKLVHSIVKLDGLKSLDEIMSHYGDYVDYFDKGIKDKTFIRTDKLEYFLKWRDKHTIIGPINVSPLKNGLSKAEFVTSFHAESKEGKTIQGTCKHWLVLEKLDDQLFIVDEKNEVYKPTPSGSGKSGTGKGSSGSGKKKSTPPQAPSTPAPTNPAGAFREQTKKFDKF